MSLSKERREQLELWTRLAPSSAPVEQYAKGDGGRNPLTCGELRALLDLADERDRYRALLEEVETDAGMVGLIEPGTLNRISAELELRHE